jgi:hypothetical protein
MSNSIPIKGADSQTYNTRTETGEDGKETQIVKDQTNWLLRMMSRVFARFSFDTSSQLRVTAAGTVAVSSGTITTVTTVTTDNMSIGDMGKPATAILMSKQLTAPNYSRLTRV